MAFYAIIRLLPKAGLSNIFLGGGRDGGGLEPRAPRDDGGGHACLCAAAAEQSHEVL